MDGDNDSIKFCTGFKKYGVYLINPDSIYCGKITKDDNDKIL